MTSHPSVLNNMSSVAGIISSRSVLVTNQSTSHVSSPGGDVVRGVGGSHGVVMDGPRIWGYMSLEYVRPVYTDEDVVLNPYTVPLYGAVLPILAVLTLITNCLTCIILTQQGMRSATGCLLVAIALSDMSMAVWPLPPFFYFYTLGHYREWVPHAWCYASLWMLEFLPTIFHATSIWLTVSLIGQRYLAVCQPLQTQRWCISNAPGAVQCSLVIFLLAAGTQLCRIFESDFSPQKLPSRVVPGDYVTGCTSEFAPFVSAFTDVYFKVYFCFKTLVVHVVPCLLVLYLTLYISFTKLKARCCRRKMAATVHTYRSRIKDYWVRMAEVKYSTTLVLTLTFLFLMVELPLAVFHAIGLIQDKMVMLEFSILPSHTLTSIMLFANMSTMVISPLKFLLFVAFCKRFRTNLKAMYFTCKALCRCCREDDDDEED